MGLLHTYLSRGEHVLLEEGKGDLWCDRKVFQRGGQQKHNQDRDQNVLQLRRPLPLRLVVVAAWKNVYVTETINLNLGGFYKD